MDFRSSARIDRRTSLRDVEGARHQHSYNSIIEKSIVEASPGSFGTRRAEILFGTSKGTHRSQPHAVRLVADASPGLIDTKLHLEAAFRHTPTTTRRPLTLGRAAINNLSLPAPPRRKGAGSRQGPASDCR